MVLRVSGSAPTPLKKAGSELRSQMAPSTVVTSPPWDPRLPDPTIEATSGLSVPRLRPQHPTDSTEKWFMLAATYKRLRNYHRKCVRQLNYVTKRDSDRITATQLTSNLGLPPFNMFFSDIVDTALLRWTGNIVRMSSERLPRQMMFAWMVGMHPPDRRAKQHRRSTTDRGSATQDAHLSRTGSLWHPDRPDGHVAHRRTGPGNVAGDDGTHHLALPPPCSTRTTASPTIQFLPRPRHKHNTPARADKSTHK